LAGFADPRSPAGKDADHLIAAKGRSDLFVTR